MWGSYTDKNSLDGQLPLLRNHLRTQVRKLQDHFCCLSHLFPPAAALGAANAVTQMIQRSWDPKLCQPSTMHGQPQACGPEGLLLSVSVGVGAMGFGSGLTVENK